MPGVSNPSNRWGRWRSVLALLALCASVALPARADEFSRVTKYSLGLKHGTLILDTRVGDIRIEGWDKPTLAIDAEKVVRAASEKKAERMYDRIRIRIDKDEEDRGYYIKTLYPSRRPWRPFRGESRLSVNFHVRMPAAANLTLKVVNGDVSVRGVSGKVDLLVNYGDVEVVVPSVWDLRSLVAKAWLGYVQSDLTGLSQDSSGWGRRIVFTNPQGQQEINVRVRMGGVFVYDGRE